MKGDESDSKPPLWFRNQKNVVQKAKFLKTKWEGWSPNFKEDPCVQ